MSNPQKRKKLARLKALMESKIVKEEVIAGTEVPVVVIPVVVDLVVEEVKTVEVLEEVLEEVKEEVTVEELQDTLSDTEVKKGKKKKE